MARSDRLRDMARKPDPIEGPFTYARAAGSVAQQLLDYRRLTKVAAAGQNRSLAVSSISRIVRGVTPPGPGMYRALASVLQIPPNTLLLVIEGDVKAIENLVMLKPDEDEPIRALILETMAQVGRKEPNHSTGA